MIAYSLDQLAAEMDAELHNYTPEQGKTLIGSLSTDSRSIDNDTLFVALKGERFDGHDFIAVAEKNAAKALLVSRKVESHLPQLIVDNTLLAMGSIGARVRDDVNPVCVALTGSNGKTSVKEMLAHILSQQHQVLFTAGNFNNDIGVPLTLLRLEQQHQYGVFELGANHQGEIDYTSGLVRPDVALVNNVASAHLEGFGSQDGVAKAKSEIFNHLSGSGYAIINMDDDYHSVMRSAAGSRSCISFGVEHQADVMATDLVSNNLGCYQFTLNFDGQCLSVQLPLAGRHQVSNALAAASTCLALDLDLAVIANGLEGLEPVKGRMQPFQLENLQVIDDSYNANPASVTAAIDWLQEIETKTCLVLGDLGELGENAALLHAELGEYAKTQQVDRLFCLGELSRHASQAFGCEHHSSFEVLVSELKQYIRQSSEPMTVLVKGSRSAKMERVVEALKVAYGQGEFV